MGSALPILLYPGTLPSAATVGEALDLTITISSIDELQRWRSAMTRIQAFIKVDLGFFRAGATPMEADRLLAAAHMHADVHVEGIYAHMSELPSARPSDVLDQLARMQAILRTASFRGTRPAIAMMSSPEGVLRTPEL